MHFRAFTSPFLFAHYSANIHLSMKKVCVFVCVCTAVGSLCSCLTVCVCTTLNPAEPPQQIKGLSQCQNQDCLILVNPRACKNSINDKWSERINVLFVRWLIYPDNWERKAVLSEELANFADECYVTEAAWKLGQALCTMLWGCFFLFFFMALLWNTLNRGKQCQRLTAVVI